MSGGEDHRHEEIDDEVSEVVECPQTTGEPADADSGDEDFDESGGQKQDRRERESCPRVVDDRGEVRRERVGPPVPNGDDHQDTEQDRPRGPQRRDVMRGKLVRKADLGAQIADESNEKDSPDQVDGARPGPGDSFASRTRDAHVVLPPRFV